VKVSNKNGDITVTFSWLEAIFSFEEKYTYHNQIMRPRFWHA